MSSRSDDLSNKKGKQMHLNTLEKKLRGVIGTESVKRPLGTNNRDSKSPPKAIVQKPSAANIKMPTPATQKSFGSALKKQRRINQNSPSNNNGCPSTNYKVDQVKMRPPSPNQGQPKKGMSTPPVSSNINSAAAINKMICSTIQSTGSNFEQKTFAGTRFNNSNLNAGEDKGGNTPDTSIVSGSSGKYKSNLNLLGRVTAKSTMPQLLPNHRDVQPPPTSPSQYSGVIGGKKDLSLLIAPSSGMPKKSTNAANSYASNLVNGTKGRLERPDARTRESEEKKKQLTPGLRKFQPPNIQSSTNLAADRPAMLVPKSAPQQKLMRNTQNSKTSLKSELPGAHKRNSSNDSRGSDRSNSGSSRTSNKNNRKNIEKSLNRFISTISKDPNAKQNPSENKEKSPGGPSNKLLEPLNNNLLGAESFPHCLETPESEKKLKETTFSEPNLQTQNSKMSSKSSASKPSGKKQKVNLQLLSEYEMYFGQLIEAPPSNASEVFASYQRLARVSFLFDFTEFEAGFKDMNLRNSIKCLLFFEKISTFIYCAKRRTLSNDMVLRAVLHYAYKGFILFIELLFSKLPPAHQSNEFLIKIKASISRRRDLFGLPVEPRTGDSNTKFKQINDLLVPLMVSQLIPGTRLHEKIGSFCQNIEKYMFYEGISRLARLLGVFPGEQVNEATVDKYFSLPSTKEATLSQRDQGNRPNNTTSPENQDNSSFSNSQNNNSTFSNATGQLNVNETTGSLAESVTIQEENEEDEEDDEEESITPVLNEKTEPSSKRERTKSFKKSENELSRSPSSDSENSRLDEKRTSSKIEEESSGRNSEQENGLSTSEVTEINISTTNTTYQQDASSNSGGQYSGKHPIPEPFLPKISKSDKKFTLVLDLDETLVHFEEVGDMGQFFIRPYAKEFIDELAQYYEVVVFTAAMQDYADWVLDRLDTEQSISYRLYRQHTVQTGSTFVKDLSRLGRDLAKMIIVDNVAENFQLQPDNGIFIKSWFNDPSDKALLELLPLLKEIVVKNARDVRLALKSFRDQMIENIKNNIENPHLNLFLEPN